MPTRLPRGRMYQYASRSIIKLFLNESIRRAMTKKQMQSGIQALRKLKINTYNQDFLLTWERSDDEIKAGTVVAEILSEMHKQGLSIRAFDAGLAISIFRDKSTRTRFSFASAVNALG